MDEQTPESIVCSGCCHTNPESARLCEKCGNPLTAYGVIAPFERIHATGWFFGKLTSQRPARLVLFGTWLLCAPLAIGTSIGVLLMISRATPSQVPWLDIVAALPALLVTAVWVAILYKVTANYVKPEDPRASVTPHGSG